MVSASPYVGGYAASCSFSVTNSTIRNLYFRRLFSDLELHTFDFDRQALDLNQDFLPFESEPERDLDSRDRMSAISILEIRFYLGNILLRDPDVFGMAHGLEIRAPLLDHELADYMFSLPGKWRVIANATECLGIFLRLYRTM